MKRRIIILTNPGKLGDENYCEGVYKDKENYISFFKAPYGGYWSDSEIKYKDKPTKSWVNNEIRLLMQDEIEFSIIIFCGHGWYSSISESNILDLNGIEEYDSIDLRKDANKRIIIHDSCRKVHDLYINESIQKLFSVKGISLSEMQRLNPDECKEYYNTTILQCPKQIICSYSCDLNETAGDDPPIGGFYSSSLIKSCDKAKVQKQPKN